MKRTIVVTIAISCILLTLAAFAYRNNRIQANDKINAIIVADEKGENTDQLIQNLKVFTSTHMNTTSDVTLEQQYKRDVTQAQKEAEGGSQYSIDVYKEAIAACPPKLNSVSAANCIRDYVNTHATTGRTTVEPKTIDKATYTYSFQSPRWAWDQAGILFTMGLTVATVAAILSTYLAISRLRSPARQQVMSKSLPALRKKQ